MCLSQVVGADFKEHCFEYLREDELFTEWFQDNKEQKSSKKKKKDEAGEADKPKEDEYKSVLDSTRQQSTLQQMQILKMVFMPGKKDPNKTIMQMEDELILLMRDKMARMDEDVYKSEKVRTAPCL